MSRAAILSFAAGVVLLQQQAELPTLYFLVPVFVVVALVAWAVRRPSVVRTALIVLAAMLAGFLWAAWRADWRLSDTLAEDIEGRDIQVVGVIAGLPRAFEVGQRFEFDVEQSSDQVPSHLALSWYSSRDDDDSGDTTPTVRAGERWQLTVRLKRPHGNINPHGFDYEGWLFERDIGATGYVRDADSNRRLASLVWTPACLVQAIREAIRDRFRQVLGGSPQAGVLVALAIGDQQSIATQDWRLFARTGVTHLLSVSGLHITMIAGLVAWATGWVWRRSPGLALRLPRQKAMAWAGLVAALLYALLAGFEVPAQRTFFMLAVVALAIATGRNLASSRVLALALFVVLLIDPWAVLAAGFWLSFGAVALLFYTGSGVLRAPGWWSRWWRAQRAVTIGLIPALLALFQQFSLVSPLANAVAIPLVSLAITPLVLLGTLPATDVALTVADGLAGALMSFLHWLDGIGLSVWQQAAPPGWAVLFGIVGVFWMLLPKGFPSRWIGLFALLPVLLVDVPRPASGDFMVRVLDVGQGLAVHVQTAQHDLLYDAGPAFSADADAGDRILVPYLRAMGVRELSALVISHQDKDHEGGASAVLAALPVDRLVTSLPDNHPLRAIAATHEACIDGLSWQWDSVDFQFLHPQAGDYEKKSKSNALSCVLKVSAAGGALLLTGDIETRTEKELLARHAGDLAATVLVPAHHGSRGSSSPEFVEPVSPRLSIVSAGYRNRFGHPNPEVVARLEARGAELLRTDRDGAVTVAMGEQGMQVTRERTTQARYWRAH